MEYIKAFEGEDALIAQYGKNKFFTVWAMGLYLDTSDLLQLAQESLTDNGDDKKIDFLRFDSDDKTLYVVQGYFKEKAPYDAAKANKASDLNTAGAWLTNGDINGFSEQMQDLVKEIRDAIDKGDLQNVELIYVHNCGETKEVEIELATAAVNLKEVLKEHAIDVSYKEIGTPTLERLYLKQVANIVIEDDITCPFKIKYEEQDDPDWKSAVISVNGTWLRNLYNTYQSRLFSANYRGYLGLNRNKINKGIKLSAEHKATKFWAYNNGITILTTKYEKSDDTTKLQGISIINGAQTTGSLGQLPATINLDNVKIMARIIQCKDPDLIASIVKFNNTQNKITSWDSYGNDETQTALKERFAELHYAYSFKRGFDSRENNLNIETCIQPLLAFIGKYKDANRSKTTVFETKSLYLDAYEKVKARHVLFVSCLFSALTEIKNENKEKINRGTGVSVTDQAVYSAFAPLKSKHFLVSIIAETIHRLNSGLPVLKDICLMPNLSDSESKPYDSLVADIKPFVKMVVYQIANYDRENGIYSHYSDTDIVNVVANHVEQQISANAASTEAIQDCVDNFMSMLCNG